MSSSTGVIYSLDGKPLAYCQNNHVYYSYLFESAEALWATFVNGKGFPSWPWVECKCGQPPEQVWFYNGHSHMPGTWCPACRALVDGFSYEVPLCTSEYKDMCDKYGCCHWPKQGTPPFTAQTP